MASKEESREKFQEDARLANEFGFDASYLDSVPHMQRPGVRFSDQAKFHPIKYLAALADRIPGEGSYLWEESKAERV